PRDQRWAMVCTTTDIFYIALASPGNQVDIDDVAVRVADGKNLITNGDFSEGMSRWFFTSDRDHLPWHAKNLALNVLLDQGLLGLALFAILIGASLGRLITVAHAHAAAPYIASAIIGF